MQCIERLREVVDGHLQRLSPKSAVFFAEQLACRSEEVEDALRLARCYHLCKQSRRAVKLLRDRRLLLQQGEALLLAASCLLECREWEECLELLGEEPPTPLPETPRSEVR